MGGSLRKMMTQEVPVCAVSVPMVWRGLNKLCRRFVPGVLLGLELNQTGLIHSHGNDLYGVNPASLKYQASATMWLVSSH